MTTATSNDCQSECFRHTPLGIHLSLDTTESEALEENSTWHENKLRKDLMDFGSD